ncbi:MAG: DUF4282 domain-containing protein [Nevskiales bacterium]
MADSDERPEFQLTGPPQWWAWIADFLRNIFDLQFRRLMTPRMLPTLFIFAIIASALAAVGYVLQGFALSTNSGLIRLFLTGPLAFLVLVVLARVALEFCLAIFRIAVHVNKMAGHTEEIAGGLPRIQFWKPLRKKSGTDDDL